jgi:hypothetical protein
MRSGLAAVLFSLLAQQLADAVELWATGDETGPSDGAAPHAARQLADPVQLIASEVATDWPDAAASHAARQAADPVQLVASGSAAGSSDSAAMGVSDSVAIKQIWISFFFMA